MSEPPMISVTIGYWNEDGTANLRVWVITAALAEDLASRLGTPHAEQMQSAEVVQTLGEVSAAVPLMVTDLST